ncbi:MAG: FAD-binding protein [Actinophytocola sp.]|uniref:FAD-binding protein n=1 Tax=Actinophytocola sp. TaxID=1872138 RepID=UPI003C70A452
MSPGQVGRRALLAAGSAIAGAMTVRGGGVAHAAGPTGPPPVVITPRDPRYPDLVRGLNQRWVGTPDAVCVASSTEQVVAAVDAAVGGNKRITVRSGGHCFENFVYNPDVDLVIDLSELTGVRFDAARDAFEVRAGSRLLDVYETLYRRWGVTVPSGICYTVGAGGHVPGGGWGMLARRHGLAVDHLEAVEVVVVGADGRARAVVAGRDPADPHHDLWWAHTGGGGGTFGIVTRFWFRTPDRTGPPPALLPSPPAEVLVLGLAWPWRDLTAEDFRGLVDGFGRWHREHADTAEPAASLCALMSLTHRAAGQLGLVAQIDATHPDAERVLADFVATVGRDVAVDPVPVTVPSAAHGLTEQFHRPRRLPWLQATRRFGTTDGLLNDPSLRMDYKSSFLREPMPRGHVDALHRWLTDDRFTNPAAMVQLHSFGGRIGSVSRHATAYAHRDAIYNMIWYVQWTDPAADDESLRWIRGCYEDVYSDTGGVPVPDAVTDGCYVNYADIDLSDPDRNRSPVGWQTLYFNDNYPRLRQIKARWDPRDVFRHAQSVRPA